MIKFYIKTISPTESEGYIMNKDKKYGTRALDRIDAVGEKYSAEEQVIKTLYNTAIALRGLDWNDEAYKNWLNTEGPYYVNKDREDSKKVAASKLKTLDYEIVRE